METLSFANRSNLDYIEQMYQTYRRNREAVDSDWRLFFEGMEFGQSSGTSKDSLSDKELRVYDLIRAYRDLGHYQATLNPLEPEIKPYAALTLEAFGLTDKDLNQSFQIGSIIGKKNAKLKDIIEHMRKSYCGNLTVQFGGVNAKVRDWVIEEFEKHNHAITLTTDEKKATFYSITKTESLERFLHSRYVGMKRFSVEGADATISMLEHLVHKGIPLGLEEIVLGMAHRGRINVLANFMDKALKEIFAEFDGKYMELNGIADGDVKYHMGYSADKKTKDGICHISLAFNPSHLEAVNPVVCGMARAKQKVRQDTKDRKRVFPVLIHGDAAFAGQGVVAETLQLSQVKGYEVGGTLHIVINNQVGFTTDPKDSRSTHYCTDIAKMLNAPVIHVNGDDAEACVRAMDIALRFRTEFRKDVVIDLVCYRRYGHNEGDEPAFTQPLMYEKIKKHPTLRSIYGEQLMDEGVIDKAYFDSVYQEKIDNLQKLLEESRNEKIESGFHTLAGLWKDMRRATPEDFTTPVNTSTSQGNIERIGKAISEVPDGFSAHPKLKKLFESRKNMVFETKQLDWGTAELMAYGSILLEGNSIRLSGQDCRRGTFTHRHAVYNDIKTGKEYFPFNQFQEGDCSFELHNSILSEYGVLGFEFGHATTDPRVLTIWEAQFGDFANTAQVIIDQFIASAESKWQRMNGMVLLLPHGYEGQGPEHSSARLERFLQLCAQDNIQVCNLTTPAQLFHALRRQIKRPFRKPLVIMSPKSLLRHPKVISPVSELTEGTFLEVIRDSDISSAKKVKRVVFCSGKLYYDLLAERENNQNFETAIVRIEQLYPFPGHMIAPLVREYSNLETIIWAQEEPKNMGAYSFITPKLQENLMKVVAGQNVSFRYVGRTERASPAIGSPKLHKQEQEDIIKGCFQ